ncbi:MAG: FMN-binding protein [Gammaproteobacteria bacterium]|nr:FMN-binding protein [Gammaproteobacteria bacterium]MBT3858434.1 FMN-binding protein [Gammaproteobacteria bacterium]MBT3986828.1 FMN-binding protein [Gammaproteobacteria bacterium]MBT4254699.1 FMN-binding protein [Gammaproteobacteria bacterium]MBT4581208.1 FMN-binding protein [Gammaproteobacteria bacterium]
MRNSYCAMALKHINLPKTNHLILALTLLTVTLFDGGGSIIHGGYVQGAQAASNTERAAMRYRKDVMPNADSFSEKKGSPPVFEAYRRDPASGEDELIGYLIYSPDYPPEPNGYSGPIKVLVGMDLEGMITGVKVIFYRESLRYSSGDFLEEPGIESQFIGMSARDRFRVGKEVDGLSRATISMRAMSRTIRNSVRHVARAYLQ